MALWGCALVRRATTIRKGVLKIKGHGARGRLKGEGVRHRGRGCIKLYLNRLLSEVGGKLSELISLLHFSTLKV